MVWGKDWATYLHAAPSDLPAAYIRFWDLFLIIGLAALWRTEPLVDLSSAVIGRSLIGMANGFFKDHARLPLYPLSRGFKRHSEGGRFSCHRRAPLFGGGGGGWL